MSDRRQETRRRFTAFTPVFDLHPRVLLGYLGDLNQRGALVIGTKLTTIDKETILEIIFPSEMAEISVIPVTIPARIAWCRPDEHPDSYNIGVEFTEVTPSIRSSSSRFWNGIISAITFPMLTLIDTHR